MNYFISRYEPCAYSPNWYKELSYAPNATVLMYNDDECYCIGYMEVNDADVEYISEQQAINIINHVDYNNQNIWYGSRLWHRWDEPVVEEAGEIDGD